MVYLLKMVIFHGYVKLPEGNTNNLPGLPTSHVWNRPGFLKDDLSPSLVILAARRHAPAQVSCGWSWKMLIIASIARAWIWKAPLETFGWDIHWINWIHNLSIRSIRSIRLWTCLKQKLLSKQTVYQCLSWCSRLKNLMKKHDWSWPSQANRCFFCAPLMCSGPLGN